jgi:RNA polymerase sigma-70 factor (ECF subfamily)
LNTALSWRRGEHRHQSRIQSFDPLPESSVADVSARPSDDERLAALYAAIHVLGPADKSLILLSLDGLSYREMADITGLTENHVGVALTRARAKLSEQLKGIRHELE